MNKAVGCLGHIFQRLREAPADGCMGWPMIKSVAEDIDAIIDMDIDIDIVSHSSTFQTADERLQWHSLYTAMLAMKLAKEVNPLICPAQDIGGAALLHDIGFLQMPDIHLGANNRPDYRQHVEFSVAIARSIQAPAHVLSMIANHHERLDGTGFPAGLTGEQMDRSSQIVAISDVFEHAITDLFFKPAVPGSQQSEVDLATIFKFYRKSFDNELLKKMIHLIGFYPVGAMVELNNRCICEVIRQNVDLPLRPVLKLVMDSAGNHSDATKLIDLKQVSVLYVTRTLAKPSAKHDTH